MTLVAPSTLTCGATGAAVAKVTAPSFVAGNSLTVSGTFDLVYPNSGGTKGFYETLQESTDNGTSWYGIVLGTTTSAGYYSLTYTPRATGDVWYRVFFTGIPTTSNLGDTGASNPSAAEAYVLPQAAHNGESTLNTTDTRYSPVTKLKIESLTVMLTNSIQAGLDNALCSWSNATNSSLQKFVVETNFAMANYQPISNGTIQNALNPFGARIANTPYIAYVAIIVSVVLSSTAIIIARRNRPAVGPQ